MSGHKPFQIIRRELASTSERKAKTEQVRRAMDDGLVGQLREAHRSTKCAQQGLRGASPERQRSALAGPTGDAVHHFRDSVTLDLVAISVGSQKQIVQNGQDDTGFGALFYNLLDALVETVGNGLLWGIRLDGSPVCL